VGRSTPFLLDQRLAYESVEEIRAAFPDVDVDVVEGCAPVMHPGGHPYTLRCIDPVTGERDVLNTRADVLSYLKWHRPQGKQVMTAEDDPAVHAAEVVAPTMSTGSGLDMSVQPTEVEGRAATFQLTYRNHSPEPITVALTAQDGDEGLRFRCEPAEPMIVPAGGVSSVLVHVVPKVREMVGVPHAYAIVLRALPVWSVRESNADLVREVRFTYVPLIPTPAPTMLPAWLRRLPVWTVPLPLVLLFLLLVLAASWTRASSTTQPTRPQPRVTSRTLALSRPSIRRFTLVHPHQGQPYELVWQTSEAQHVTLDGWPVSAHGAMVLQAPLHSALYRLEATNGSRRATAHLHVVVDSVGRATQQLRVTGGALAATARPPSAVPTLWLNPNAVHFAKDGAHTTGGVQTIHVTNVSGRHITITNIGISGTNPSDFTKDDTCTGATLVLFGRCTISVRFTPVMPGPHRATLLITDDTTGSAQTVPLSADR
jgi:hypothetical protein